MQPSQSHITIRPARQDDSPLIRKFIRDLAEYEKLLDQVDITEEQIDEHLFGDSSYASVIIAEYKGVPAGFALYFHTFSTFLGKPGIYLEDLFVSQDKRGLGIGSALLKHLAQLCIKNDFGRLEWSVLDWNEPAIKVYDRIGAKPMSEWIPYRLSGAELDDFARK
jgi:GNAT superfamily N-acetyltransferase